MADTTGRRLKLPTNNDGYERKEHDGLYDFHSAMGRSSAWVDCPFCGAKVLVYLWSLAGSGKKCECGAVIYWNGAKRKIQKSAIQKDRLSK